MSTSREFAVDKSNAPIVQENDPIWRPVQQGAHLSLGALEDLEGLCHLRDVLNTNEKL